MDARLIFCPLRSWFVVCATAMLTVGCGGRMPLQSAYADDKPGLDAPNRGFKMKTLGGRQFWGDEVWFHGWRIQQNVLTKHYRLIDPGDYRHYSGTREDCLKELEKIKKDRKLEPMKGKAVVLVHGIIRSSKSLGKMKARLEKDGYAVVGFDYPSTRVDIPTAAYYLQKVVESREGFEEIHFVVHSMGGLIVRQLCADCKDDRIKRIVMLGVPNNGAQLADSFQKLGLYKALLGPAGQQLVTNRDGLIMKLPTPTCEFAIIAGAKGTLKGYNPLIPGDDDGTVTVASTRLPGATDFMTVRALHSFMMGNAEVIETTARFLNKGHLRKDGTRHPIPRKAAVADRPRAGGRGS